MNEDMLDSWDIHNQMVFAHEWYHIGEIGMTLTLSGHKLDYKTLYCIWAWGRWNVQTFTPEEEA